MYSLRLKYPNFPFQVPHLQVQKERKKDKKGKKGKKEKGKNVTFMLKHNSTRCEKTLRVLIFRIGVCGSQSMALLPNKVFPFDRHDRNTEYSN